MPTAAQVKHLRDLTGSGMADVKAALMKAGDDPWLAMGFLHVKGVAVALNKKLPDGSRRPATKEEADAYWASEAHAYATEYRRERPRLAEDIARLEHEMSGETEAFTEVEIAVLRAAKAEIETHLGPCAITLFGSRARRDHRENSDFDLLVVPEDDAQARPNAEHISEVEDAVRRLTGVAADLNLQLVPAHVLEDAYFEWPFLPNAIAEGIDINEIIEVSPTPNNSLGMAM